MKMYFKRVMALAAIMIFLIMSVINPVMAGDINLGYKLGKGLTIESSDGDYKLNISGRLQFRFTYNNLETTPDNNTFAVQRGKIKLNGHVVNESLKYEFQANFATRGGATTGVGLLEDYWIDYFPVSYFGVKVGQFKTPFMWQGITSSGSQQFVDRSLFTGIFNPAYDLGINLHGNLFSKKMNYNVFFMNGDGANTIDTNQSLMAGGRVEYIPFGEYAYSESDVSESDEFNLGFGLGYLYNVRGTASQSGSIAAGTKTSHGTFDMGLKYKGFSFTGAAALSRTHEAPKLTNWGYNMQTGYFIVPKHFEVALKHGGTIFSDALRNQYEYALGLNYFFIGHGIKLQTDYTYLQNVRGVELDDHRIRSQVQVIF